MSERRPRLWETPHVVAPESGGDERFGVPADEPVEAVGIGIDADDSGFTVANSSESDASVLITLMARASGADAADARERLLLVTSTASSSGVLHATDPDEATLYARLWHDDIEAHERRNGGWTASRSGATVVALRAGATFRLQHDSAALREGVVVAAIAGLGFGVDGALRPVDRGPAASIGERPAPPQ